MESSRLDPLVFLCGDVMTGRGIDQILPHPGNPALRERVVTDAQDYVSLAERVNGKIPVPTEFTWPWGEALDLLDGFAPDARLINLETTITTAGEFAHGKAVHYRMHPGNIGCLTAVQPDACALANNHILDFGTQGLADTLQALTAAGIRGLGAGPNADHAEQLAVVAIREGGRILIASCGMVSSGIPRRWAAGKNQPGVAVVPDLSDRSAAATADRLVSMKRPGDIAIVSVHWGSNWGYDVEQPQVDFAHRLIDAGVDIVHGHSSHHPRPVELYQGKLILYGCGDTIDDYEGIKTFDAFRHELRLLYFVSIDRTSGHVVALRMTPMRMRRMRLEHAPSDDAEWLRSTLEHISRPFGTRVETVDGALSVRA